MNVDFESFTITDYQQRLTHFVTNLNVLQISTLGMFIASVGLSRFTFSQKGFP